MEINNNNCLLTVSEKINQFIAENGGNERDALNVALAKLELAEIKNEELQKRLNQLYDYISSIDE